MSNGINLALVGASGVVGKKIISLFQHLIQPENLDQMKLKVKIITL